MKHPSREQRWFEDLGSFSRRVLTTVLFTDVVDSTASLVELGDRAWADLLRDHHARFRSRLIAFGGREVDAAGDGFLAAFEVPTIAVAFACAFHHDVVDLGLQVRDRGAHGRVRTRGWEAPWSYRPSRGAPRERRASRRGAGLGDRSGRGGLRWSDVRRSGSLPAPRRPGPQTGVRRAVEGRSRHRGVEAGSIESGGRREPSSSSAIAR